MSSSAIKVAIAGFGTSGRIFHAPFLAADPHYEISAIVTASPERTGQARSEYPGARVLTSMDELWQRAPEYDLLVIGTPNSEHAAHAEAGLRAGLHVVVDKPAALSAHDVRELIELAEQRGRVFTVFQNRRWDGDFLALRCLIERGELGAVHRFESRFEWWKPVIAPSWKGTAPRASGGGIVYDLGPHLVDQAMQLFGPVLDVHAELHRRRSGAAAEDDAFLSLLHEGGVRSHLHMSGVAAGRAPRFHVLGSKAGFTSWGLDRQEPVLLSGMRPEDAGFATQVLADAAILEVGSEVRTLPAARGDYGVFYAELAKTVLDGAPPPVDPQDAAAALEVIELAFDRSPENVK